MDFDLEEELQKLINQNELTVAIDLVERELGNYDETGFPKIIGKTLLSEVEKLTIYLEDLIEKLNHQIDLKAIFISMNGFSINYDEWFIETFGFESIGSMDNLDWLADYPDLLLDDFVIKGFKAIQKVYKKHHKNKMYEAERHEEAADICDYAVILRLQELVDLTIKKGKANQKKWADITFFVGSHDSELIYRIN